MKTVKQFLLTCLLSTFLFAFAQAQNYYIDFTASGTTTTLDSVFVQNLTQSTSLTLGGSDTLHLIGTVDITNKNQNSSNIRIYPNPFNEKSYMEFYNETQTMIAVDIYDVVGKNVLSLRQELESGLHIFEMSGFATGHYQLIVKTDTWQKTAAFVSLQTDRMQKPQLQFRSTLSKETYTNIATRNGSKNTVQMSYTTGNQMRFTGFSGALSDIVNDVPTLSKTIDFIYSSSSCGAILIDGRDSNQYQTILIGSQCWLAKNLAYLPSVVGPSTGSNTIPYYYVSGYNDTVVADAKITTNYTAYGVLYNWPAAMAGATASSNNPSGVKGVCPTGWHLPSDSEWTQLTDFLGGESVAGGKLKASGFTHWSNPNTGATNSSCFTALPGGIRYDHGIFNYIGYGGSWWSTMSSSVANVWIRYLEYNSSNANRSSATINYGFSIRCIKD